MCKGKSWELDNSLGQIKGTLFEPSDEDVLIDPELVLELKKKGVKFTEEDLLFVTRDSSGEIVFLEKGNPGAGLEHIINGTEDSGNHKNKFKDKLNLEKEDIGIAIYKFIKEDNIINVKPSKDNGKNVIYCLNNKYLHIVIASNGFIVTAYPASNDEIERLIQ
ncbi:MAG: hypothetical protein IJS60_04015 [Abditibacteriota bacterium]|nr:hypothetical protein [Abditibacteriota bacterium]